MNNVIGNPLVTPMRVPDYNQNNPNKADYIKNRPFYDGSTCICDYNETFDYGKINPAVQINEGITLVKGEHLLFEIIEDGKVSYDEIERLGTDDMGGGTFSFKSGRFYSWVEATNTIQIQTWQTAYEISVKITRPGELKQLDEKFIPDNIKYAYETEKICEGVVEQDDGEIAPIINDGVLKAGDTIIIKDTLNGVTEEHTIVLPSDFGGLINVGKICDNIGYFQFVGTTTLHFGSCPKDTKIEVYKLNKKPISEVISDIDAALDRVIEKYELGGDA